jgi:hypothetical protein
MNLAELLYLHLIIQTCCFDVFNINVMNFMQVKELRPPLAFISPFYPSTCSWSVLSINVKAVLLGLKKDS